MLIRSWGRGLTPWRSVVCDLSAREAAALDVCEQETVQSPQSPRTSDGPRFLYPFPSVVLLRIGDLPRDLQLARDELVVVHST